MQKIRILTDSASDIPQSLADELQITVLPIPITHEGRSYHERVELTNEQFYDLLLSSNTIPTTAHITSLTYLEEYKKAYDEGCTGLLNITINSLGSNMFDAATLAKSMFYDEIGPEGQRMQIEVLDSKTYTMAYGAGVIHAARMAQQGATLDEIAARITDWFSRVEILCSVYSLDFARKSGRVSSTAAFVGELLGLRPVILFKNGVNTVIDKVRGDKAIIPKLAELSKKRSSQPENYPLLIVRGTPTDEAEQLLQAVKAKFGAEPEGPFSIGACIAINSGPKVIAVIYAGEKV